MPKTREWCRVRSMGLFSALATAALALALALAPGSAQGDDFAFGFSEAALHDTLSAESQARAAQLESEAGADIHRVVVSWKAVERQRSNFDWSYYDRLIGAIRNAGMQPLITIAHAPSWATAFLDCEGPNCPPGSDYLDEWARFAHLVTLRYPDAYAIEIWNEPNIWGQWSTLIGPDPERYAQLFNAAAGAIHAADPSMRVLAGAVTYWDSEDGRRRMTMPTFLERFYRAGGARELRPQDGLSIHAYPWIDELETLDTLFPRIVGQARDAIARWDPGRDIYITESGVTSTGPWAVSERSQARGLLTLRTMVPTMPDIHALVIHSSVAPPFDPNHQHEIGYGLLNRQTLQPSLAFCALAEFAGSTPGSTGCAAGVLEGIGWESGGGDPGDPTSECERSIAKLKRVMARLKARRAVLKPNAQAGHVPSIRAVRRLNERLGGLRADLRLIKERCS